MEEKVLIKSEKFDLKKRIIPIIAIIIILSCSLFRIMYSYEISKYSDQYDEYHTIYEEHQDQGYCLRYHSSGEACSRCEWIEDHPIKIICILTAFNLEVLFICVIPIGSISLICGLIYLGLQSCELTVTDKRIYGKTLWGKRVDLPVDSVSATASAKTFKGITVSTSSGKISFLAIKNANAIYKEINKLLINRQKEKVVATPVVASAYVLDKADQLKKYKELLDMGAITQEEFDAKKKELLGL